MHQFPLVSAFIRSPAHRLVTLALTGFLLSGCATTAGPPEDTGYQLTDLGARELVTRGQGREALAYYKRRALELDTPRARPTEVTADAYSAAATVARHLGLYREAIRSTLRAIEILDGARANDDILRKRARLQGSLVRLYEEVGDLAAAQRHLEALREIVGRFTLGYAVLAWSAHISGDLSRLASVQGDYLGALAEGEKAIRSLETYLDETERNPRWWQHGGSEELRQRNRAELASVLITAGSAASELGRLDDAEGLLQRAIEAVRQVRAPELEAAARAVLADVAYKRGDSARAEREAADALAESARLNYAPLTALIQARRGARAAEQGRHQNALEAYEQAIQLAEVTRDELQDAGLRGLYLENKQAMYHGAVRSALALGKADEAFSYAERGRARAFLDLLGNRTMLSKGRTRALVEEEARLRAQLDEARERTDGALARRRQHAAERAYRLFLERVRKENLEQAALMTVEPVTLAEVQGLLPDGTTLLEYLVTDTEAVLWVVDRRQMAVVRLPGDRAALVRQVRTFRDAIAEQAPLEQIQRLASGLYERLVGPVRPHLRDNRLLIVPHDVLHYLPFAALRSPMGRWLVAEHTLATLPSASVLKYLHRKGEKPSDGVLALGNPDIGPALTLRYAEREARAVGKRFPAATVLVRAEATESRVKALGPRAGLLHFATHGELSEQDPLSSALLLVPDETEDGRLEVRELFGLDLNAWLVVLSACETGLGKLSRGDEVVGLQRAFLYAGTPAVVTTLWKVDDRASYFLMRKFYEQLGARGPADALRQAQSAALDDFPHPFFWAALGLAGSPR